MSEYTLTSKNFYKALKQKQLIGSKCQVCGSYAIPQRQICPKCHSDQNEITTYVGSGTLKAFTVIFVPPGKMAEAGYNAKNPYCVGIVELDEGPRISAQILDVDIIQPENIKIGTKMEMTTITRGEEADQTTFLAFRPA